MFVVANIILCVCACVHVRVCFFPCYATKGALMLYILNVEHTMGEVEATMGHCTSRWSPQMASTLHISRHAQ